MPKKPAPSSLPRISIVPVLRGGNLYKVKISGERFPINSIINIEIFLVDKLRSFIIPYISNTFGIFNYNTDNIGSFKTSCTVKYGAIFKDNSFSSVVEDEFLSVFVSIGGKTIVTGVLKDVFKFNPYKLSSG